MNPEILFILFFTFLLVFLLVPVGGYTTYRDRYGHKRVEPDSGGGDEEIGMGLTMLFFFLVLFPLMLAGNAWIVPYGPVFMGITWVPILVLGLFLALILTAITPRRPRRKPGDSPADVEAKASAGMFGISFFLLLILATAVFWVSIS